MSGLHTEISDLKEAAEAAQEKLESIAEREQINLDQLEDTERFSHKGEARAQLVDKLTNAETHITNVLAMLEDAQECLEEM